MTQKKQKMRLPRFSVDPGLIRRATPWLAIGAAAACCVALVALALVPSWKAVREQEAALVAARQEVEARQATADLMARTLQGELEKTLAANAQVTDALLSRSETTEILNRLYQEAQAGGVQVTALRTQPGPQDSETAPYQVRNLQLSATGTLPGLLGMISRVQEANPDAALIFENLQAESGTSGGTMTVSISLYTSTEDATPSAETAPESAAAEGFTGEAASGAQMLVPPAEWPDGWDWPSGTEATPATGAAPMPAGTTTHVVAAGDTLYALATQHGVTVADLQAANGLPDDHIYAGQVLRIPPPAG